MVNCIKFRQFIGQKFRLNLYLSAYFLHLKPYKLTQKQDFIMKPFKSNATAEQIMERLKNCETKPINKARILAKIADEKKKKKKNKNE